MWKPKGKPAFRAGLYLWLAGWPCFSTLSPHPLAYQPRNTVDILTSQSLFTNYFTHYGSHCAQPHPVHLVSGIKINLSIQARLRANIKLQIQHNIITMCCIISHLFLRMQYHEAIIIWHLISGIVSHLFLTLDVIKLKYFLPCRLKTVCLTTVF